MIEELDPDASAIAGEEVGFVPDDATEADCTDCPDEPWVSGGVDPEPRVNQLAREDLFLGDGSTTSFTTSYPYLPLSLNVLVNGYDWTTSAVTETDPTTGAYDVSPAFPLNSDVQVLSRRAS